MIEPADSFCCVLQICVFFLVPIEVFGQYALPIIVRLSGEPIRHIHPGGVRLRFGGGGDLVALVDPGTDLSPRAERRPNFRGGYDSRGKSRPPAPADRHGITAFRSCSLFGHFIKPDVQPLIITDTFTNERTAVKDGRQCLGVRDKCRDRMPWARSCSIGEPGFILDIDMAG